MQHKKLAQSCILGLAALASSAMAQITEITRFDTIHGEVIHGEDDRGRSSLKFTRKGNMVPLSADWKNVTVEQVIDLNGQTGILMSHAVGRCESRASLLVVTQKVFWGPYDVGDCEDVLAYQKSENGEAFIAIRTDKANGNAWVYSSDDESFRGPVSVRLPESMAFMVPDEDVARPIQKGKSVPRPAPAKKPSSPIRVQDSLDPEESVVDSGRYKPAQPVKPAPIALIAPIALVAPTSSVSVVPAQVKASPVKAVASTSGALSSGDASKVVTEVKKSTGPQRPKVMIAL